MKTKLNKTKYYCYINKLEDWQILLSVWVHSVHWLVFFRSVFVFTRTHSQKAKQITRNLKNFVRTSTHLHLSKCNINFKRKSLLSSSSSSESWLCVCVWFVFRSLSLTRFWLYFSVFIFRWIEMCCDDSRTVARALTYTQQIAMDFDEQLFTSKHQQQPFDTHTSTTKALIAISVLPLLDCSERSNLRANIYNMYSVHEKCTISVWKTLIHARNDAYRMEIEQERKREKNSDRFNWEWCL